MTENLRVWAMTTFSAAFTALLLMLFAGPATLAEARGQSTVQDPGPLRLEISLSERELYEFIGGELVNTYPVAVGQPGHPTPPGEYEIFRVDWNPDWTPPDSEWAEGREYKEPGHPDNPMGRARIVFNPPYTIHGTEALHSLGEAASHGSVRVSNEVAKNLARRVMEHGGASRGQAWYEATIANPTVMREVEIPNPIPLTIVE